MKTRGKRGSKGLDLRDSDFFVPYDHFDEICRVCLLQQEEDLYNISEISFLHNIGLPTPQTINLVVIIKKYCNIEYSKDDRKPQKICTACINSISKSFNCFETILDSEKKLTKILEEKDKLKREILNDIKPPKFHDYDNEDDYFSDGGNLFDERDDDELSDYRPARDSDDTSDSEKEQKRSKRKIPKFKGNKVQTVFDDGERFLCQFCDTKFTDIHKVIEHNDKEHIMENQCLICLKAMKNMTAFHISTHSELNNYSCRPCRKYFSNEADLNVHKEKYDHDNGKQCQICQKQFNSRSLRNQHMVMHYGDKRFKCDLCGKTFRYQASRDRHKQRHIVPKPFLCSSCGKKFTTKIALSKHIGRVHEGPNANLPPEEVKDGRGVHRRGATLKFARRKGARGPRPSQMVDMECEYCGEILPSKPSYSRHVKLHPEFCDYPCRICKAQFTTKETLKDHIDTNHNRHPCKFCDRGFPYFSALEKHYAEKHRDQHVDEASFYRCPYCPFKAAIKPVLESHMLTHSGEKPFVCETCGKAFRQKSHLSVHRYQHTGKKPNKCHVCGKCFTFRATLISHIRIHTGERPFPCQYCDRSYRDSTILHKHKKKAHPEMLNMMQPRFKMEGMNTNHLDISRNTVPPENQQALIVNHGTPQ